MPMKLVSVDVNVKTGKSACFGAGQTPQGCCILPCRSRICKPHASSADQLARGFLIGATAGRTTLTGEGLQHADGHSPLAAGAMPHVVHYDPAYGYEIRHIVKDGLERMYGDGSDARDQNVVYYLTVYNEPMPQPAEPEDVDVDGILKGIYQLSPAEGDGPRAQILASGVGVPWALEAQRLLADGWGGRAGR